MSAEETVVISVPPHLVAVTHRRRPPKARDLQKVTEQSPPPSITFTVTVRRVVHRRRTLYRVTVGREASVPDDRCVVASLLDLGEAVEAESVRDYALPVAALGRL